MRKLLKRIGGLYFLEYHRFLQSIYYKKLPILFSSHSEIQAYNWASVAHRWNSTIQRMTSTHGEGRVTFSLHYSVQNNIFFVFVMLPVPKKILVSAKLNYLYWNINTTPEINEHSSESIIDVIVLSKRNWNTSPSALRTDHKPRRFELERSQTYELKKQT